MKRWLLALWRTVVEWADGDDWPPPSIEPCQHKRVEPKQLGKYGWGTCRDCRMPQPLDRHRD